MTYTRIRVGVIIIDIPHRESIARNKEDWKILLTKMKKPKQKPVWVLVGGGKENGESLADCAMREVYEETGLSICVADILYVKELYNENTEQALEVVMQGEIIGGRLRKGGDPEDKESKLVSVEWVRLGDLEKINFHPKQLRTCLLKDLKNGYNHFRYLGVYKYPESAD